MVVFLSGGQSKSVLLYSEVTCVATCSGVTLICLLYPQSRLFGPGKSFAC